MNYNALTTEEILQHAYMAENSYTHPLYVELRKRLAQTQDEVAADIPEEYAEDFTAEEFRTLLDKVAFYKDRISIKDLCDIISKLSDLNIRDAQALEKVFTAAQAFMNFRAECAQGIRSLVEYFDNNTPIEL